MALKPGRMVALATRHKTVGDAQNISTEYH